MPVVIIIIITIIVFLHNNDMQRFGIQLRVNACKLGTLGTLGTTCRSDSQAVTGLISRVEGGP